MKLRYWLVVAAAGCALGLQSLPAAAQERDPFEKFEAIQPEVLLRGIIREDDVDLLFRHVRESITAAARGEEPRESEAMARRSEEIQREIAVRGSMLAGVLMSAFETAAKQMIREAIRDMNSERSRPRIVAPSPAY